MWWPSKLPNITIGQSWQENNVDSFGLDGHIRIMVKIVSNLNTALGSGLSKRLAVLTDNRSGCGIDFWKG
jgi:hypothetical protein